MDKFIEKLFTDLLSRFVIRVSENLSQKIQHGECSTWEGSFKSFMTGSKIAVLITVEAVFLLLVVIPIGIYAINEGETIVGIILFVFCAYMVFMSTICWLKVKQIVYLPTMIWMKRMYSDKVKTIHLIQIEKIMVSSRSIKLFTHDETIKIKYDGIGDMSKFKDFKHMIEGNYPEKIVKSGKGMTR